MNSLSRLVRFHQTVDKILDTVAWWDLTHLRSIKHPSFVVHTGKEQLGTRRKP